MFGIDESLQLRLRGGKYRLYDRIRNSRLGQPAAIHVAMVSLGEHPCLLTTSIPDGGLKLIRDAAAEEGVLEIFGTAPIMRPHP